MATPIVMPRLGDFMTEGTVVRLARSQGDEVGRGEVIAEIETEKLNYDLEAVAGGIFHPVVVEGATVAVDGLIAYVLEAGEKAPEAETPQARSAPTSAPQAPARRPAAASGGEAHSARLRALAGSPPVSESISSQVTPTGPGGRIVEADVRAFAEQQSAAPAVVPSTPAARRLASSLGVDLSQVTPTGPEVGSSRPTFKHSPTSRSRQCRRACLSHRAANPCAGCVAASRSTWATASRTPLSSPTSWM